jgi:transposase-like protein
MATKKSSHPEELKEQARKMMEEEGCTLTETARRLELTPTVVHDWAKNRGWIVPEVIRQVRVQEQKIKVDPDLDLLLKRMETLPRNQRETEYDEAMHRLACSIPLIVSRLGAADLVVKADKVAKLVEMSRNVLGRNDLQKSKPMISLGILSAGHLPERRADPLQLPDAELVE